MSTLSKKTTEDIAKLAKLKLTSDEISKFTPQLSAVVDLIDQLNEVNTKNIEPTAQTTGLTNILRKDEINEMNCLPQDEPFEVPQIIKKNL